MKKLSSIVSIAKQIQKNYYEELFGHLALVGFFGLKEIQIEVFLYICANENSTIKEISDACKIKKQTLTSILNNLEKKGYLTRKTSDDDKRFQKIKLTDFGRELKKNLTSTQISLEDKYGQSISPSTIIDINLILKDFVKKTKREDYNRVNLSDKNINQFNQNFH